MPLPIVLAGPILRRTDIRAVWIWLCTSEEIDIYAKIYSVRQENNQREHQIGQRERILRIQLGEKLFIHLIKASPISGRFPHSQVMTYELLEINENSNIERLRGYDERKFGIHPYTFPTFVIQNPRSNALRAIFTSCRKLHGDGIDASKGMLDYVKKNLRGSLQNHRPTATFLLGDQIYADDVCDILFPSLVRIANDLDTENLPELQPHHTRLGVAARQLIINRDAGFTSEEASNHLMALGEYAAMYLFAWNEEIWDPEPLWGTPGAFYEAIVSGGVRSGVNQIDYFQKWNQWKTNLKDGMQGSLSLKVIMANVPTYMMFDDHDVTDDWNINSSWKRYVSSKPLGRRIITNALVSYWAFQAWGNNPDGFDQEFIDKITNYLANRNDAENERRLYRYLNNDFNGWSFKTPTQPVSIFMDFRTHRSAASNTDVRDYIIKPTTPLSPNVTIRTRMNETRLTNVFLSSGLNGMAPRLMNSDLKRKMRDLLSDRERKPVILITGTPVIGSNTIDFGQELLIFLNGAFVWDAESWRSDPESLLDLFEIIFEINPSVCAILSGDVHYGYSALGVLENSTGRKINIGQFTSSSAKNISFPSIINSILRSDRISNSWIYEQENNANNDGVGFSTIRIMQNTESQYFLSRYPVYCKEFWELGEIITQTNFGVLVSTNNTRQIYVQIYSMDSDGQYRQAENRRILSSGSLD